MIQVKVTRQFTINFDGSAEDYIRLANALTDQGLDSLDLGDATGALIDDASLNSGINDYKATWHSFVTGKTQICTVRYIDEIFRYTHPESNTGTMLTDNELTHLTDNEIHRAIEKDNP